MYRNMKDLISDVFGDITIDRKLIRKLNDYVHDWQYKKVDNTDHSSFLGSNLIGTERVVFAESDSDKFYKNIIQKSEDSLRLAYRAMDDLNTDYNVGGNTFYITIVILMHMCYDNKRLSNTDRKEALTALSHIIGYKMFSAMYNWFFKKTTSEDISKATYERLNGKFLLKKYGNWQGVFNHRALDVLPNGIFEKKLREFSTQDLTEVITGIYGRYREMIKNLFIVQKDVMDKNERISVDNKIVTNQDDDDSKDSFKEVISEHVRYIQYVKSIMNSETDLVNSDYIYLINHLISRCSKENLENLLSGLSSIPYPTDPKDDYVERILTSSFSYLTTKGITNNYHKQVSRCLIYLKNYWSAGNIKEPEANNAKKMSIVIVENIIGTKNRNIIPSIAIGFMLYIFCLAVASSRN